MTIQRERSDDGVEVIRLDRPAQRNAFDSAMLADVNGALDELANDGDLRLLVFSTTNTTRCRPAPTWPRSSTPKRASRAWRRSPRCTPGVVGFPLPTICVCVGHCVGAGAELAAGCDLRVAGDNMKARWVGAAHGVPVGPARLAPLVGQGPPRT